VIASPSPPVISHCTEAYPGDRWDGDRWDADWWDGDRWDGDRWDGDRWDADRWDADWWDGDRWDADWWDADWWNGDRWDGDRWNLATRATLGTSCVASRWGAGGTTDTQHMTPADWDARTYDRVADPMTRWGATVLDRLPLGGDERVLDAGCGSGRVTEHLLERLPRGRVVALDASPAMLEEARRRLSRFDGRVEFVQADLAHPLPIEGTVDAILSTATFHWVLDQDALFHNLAGVLRPGGWLASQSGGAGNIARFLQVVAGIGDGWQGEYRFETPESARARLVAAGFVEIDTWLSEELIRFEPGQAFEAYIETVCLRPHLDRLPPTERRIRPGSRGTATRTGPRLRPVQHRRPPRLSGTRLTGTRLTGTRLIGNRTQASARITSLTGSAGRVRRKRLAFSVTHRLDPGRTVFGRIERFSEIVSLAYDLPVTELHDEDGLRRSSAVIANRALRDPDIAAADGAADVEGDLERRPLVNGHDVSLAANSLAALRPLDDRVVCEDLGRRDLILARDREVIGDELSDRRINHGLPTSALWPPHVILPT